MVTSLGGRATLAISRRGRLTAERMFDAAEAPPPAPASPCDGVPFDHRELSGSKRELRGRAELLQQPDGDGGVVLLPQDVL